MMRFGMAMAALLLLGPTTACNPAPPTVASAQLSDGLELNAGVTPLTAETLPPLASGQVVYVPVYSEIYDADPGRRFPLTATLSLRNTDPTHPIIVKTIDYYDSAGTLVTAYLSQPVQLAPLTSTAVVVDSRNTSGGTGANFLVTWGAEAEASPPVIEAVMISTASQQGVSFVSPGRVIQARTAP